MAKASTIILIFIAFFLGAIIAMNLDSENNKENEYSDKINELKNKVYDAANNLKTKFTTNKDIKNYIDNVIKEYSKLKNKPSKEKIAFLEKELKQINNKLK